MPSIKPNAVKKKKKLIALPGEHMTRVVIPTKLVNAEYSYTLIQERIFNYVLHYLQYYIKQVIEGKEVMQLDMFKSDTDSVNITIPLMTIAKPAYYDRARQAAKEMAAIVVAVPFKRGGKDWDRIRGLFQYIEMPRDERQRSGSLTLSMSKDVAQMLVDIEVKQGIPRDYTAFMFEVTMLANNKYTPRFYKMLSSWKKKGKCYMTIEEIKTWLQLGDKYKNYNGIKQSILKPVAKDLKAYADCWFDLDHPEFEDKDGTKVVGLWFHIVTPELSLHYVKLKESIIEILKRHFHLEANHLKQLEPIMNMQENDYGTLQYKILDLAERIRKDRSIRNIPAYVVKSLLNYHTPRPDNQLYDANLA